MKPMKKLLAVIAIAGTIGPGHAVDRHSAHGMPIPTTDAPAGIGFIPTQSITYSFADICKLTIGAEYPMRSAWVADLTPVDGIASAWSPLSNPMPTLYGGASIMNATAPPGSPLIGLGNLLGAEADALRVAAGADRTSAGDGHLFSLAAIPEPADWMLLGGIVVMASMAKRRRTWSTRSGATLGNPPSLGSGSQAVHARSPI